MQANKVAEDVLRVMNLKLVGREMVGNRPAIVIEFSSQTNAKPLTPRGKELLSCLAGETWVDETDHVISPITWRFLEGSVGNPVLKTQKGGRSDPGMSKFRDEMWLPAYSERRSGLRFFFGKRISLHPERRIFRI